MIRTRDLLKRF